MPAYVRRQAPRSAPVPSARVREAAERMLHELKLERCELSVLLTNDAFIHTLNQVHRGKDRPTDVLAFPLDAEGESIAAGGATPVERRGAGKQRGSRKKPRPRAWAPPADGLLGDVIISLDTARRQARARGHSLMHEVRFLLAHGLLHLIGYDHQTDAEESSMNAMTRRLVDASHSRTTTP